MCSMTAYWSVTTFTLSDCCFLGKRMADFCAGWDLSLYYDVAPYPGYWDSVVQDMACNGGGSSGGSGSSGSSSWQDGSASWGEGSWGGSSSGSADGSMDCDSDRVAYEMSWCVTALAMTCIGVCTPEE